MSASSYYIVTYGCQMNRHDSAVLEGALAERGLSRAPSPEEADVIIFNTCAVRQHAEDRLFSNIGKLKHLKKRRPELVIGVVGCVAQKEGRSIIERLPHVSFVAGTRELASVPETVEKALGKGRFQPAATESEDSGHPLPVPSSRARLEHPWSAQLAVMRGCNNFCSYCIVPLVRGRETSRPPKEVEDEAKRLLDRGVSEITLLGQNIDAYGKDLSPRSDLAHLIERLSRLETEGLRRLRFITNHPRDISDRLLATVRDSSVACEYFHVPAQAGSDRILKTMNRGYDRARYLDMLERIREHMPSAGIASDFIVGFPGETEEDFQDTLSLVERARFQSAFIFKYSPRPGTRASELPDDVPPEEKARRHRALAELQREISLRTNRETVGKDLEVLIEGPSPRNPERLISRSRDFRIVILPPGAGEPGEYVNVRIASATPLALYAEGTSPGESDLPADVPEEPPAIQGATP